MINTGGRAGVGRASVVNLAGAAVAGVAGVGITWLVARGLGPGDAGVFFAGTAAFVLAVTVAKLGTQTGLVYWIARLRALGATGALGSCLRIGLTPVVVASLVVGGLLAAFADELAALAGRPESGDAFASTLRLLAVFVPFAALTDALLAATRGYRAMRPTVILDKLTRPALQLLMIATWWGALLSNCRDCALWDHGRPHQVVVLWAGPWMVVVVLAGVWLTRIHARAKGGTDGPRVGAGEFWRFTGPRAVAGVVQQALQRVDVLIVAALAGFAEAALYTVAIRFVIVGQLANQAIAYAVQPRLAEALTRGDRARAAELYRTATGWLILLAWPPALLAAVFAPVYLRLFGAEYVTATAVMVTALVAAGVMVATGCGMVDMVLAMAGRTAVNLGNVVLALAVTVGLSLWLVPAYGALGAAVGLVAALLVNNLVPLVQVAAAVRISPFGRGTFTAAGLALAVFGALPMAVTTVLGHTVSSLAVTLALAVPLYLAGCRHHLGRERAVRGERPVRGESTTARRGAS